MDSRVPARKSWIRRSNTQYLTVSFRTFADGPLTALVPLTAANTCSYFRFRVYWCLPLQRSHSSLGNQHAHLLQYRPTVLESTRYHQPSSSGTLRSCRSCSSSTPASSSISRTCHNRSHRFVHSPLHDSTCRRPICLIIRHRHHDDVDSRHPKYTVSSAPISAGGPSHSPFSHSHGNRSVHLSLTRHTASVSSPFLHFTSGPVHFRLSWFG